MDLYMQQDVNGFIQFDRCNNFRDIGGLKTGDGGMMKSGILFRSDKLARLSCMDLERFKKLNVRLICDLRTEDKFTSRPDRIPEGCEIRIVNVPFLHPHQDPIERRLLKFLFCRSAEPDIDSFIREYYRGISLECTSRVREVINLISDKNNLPALIHCNAGKDRTGFISALLQLLAGVPREAVMENYLLTNSLYEPHMKRLIRWSRLITLFQVAPERIRQIIEVRREYLDETLDNILVSYGSIEGYLTKGCGTDMDTIQNLKALLLE